MTRDDALITIASIADKHPTFKPLGMPTVTPRGARIEFQPVTVSPMTVVKWFEGVGACVLMIGTAGLQTNRGEDAYMVLEWAA